MAKIKVLITGAHGQLGREVFREFEKRKPGIAEAVGHDTLDITDARAVDAFLKDGDYTHVINCAAFTAVDRAEDDKLECAKVNIDGITNIARHADELNLKIIHISTDYVFDGNASVPYDESAVPRPKSVYGTTKRKGETALLGLDPSAIIIRTGWLYSSQGRNFVHAILKKALDKQSISVVCDQIGTPTYAADLAAAIVDITLNDKWIPGIYHYSNEGVASWYDFAIAILESAGLYEQAAKIAPVPSSDYPTRAERPHYSVLDKQRIKATFGITIPHWQTSLRQCMTRIKNQ